MKVMNVNAFLFDINYIIMNSVILLFERNIYLFLQEKNKVSLRNLSMVLRQIGKGNKLSYFPDVNYFETHTA